ncbi:MAG: hypothetical protein H8E51_08580 [Bacteroidetes bacterium]|nr:hypothetical protein [Bacteroidota bacterium]
MKTFGKWIIVIFIAAVLTVFTVVAFVQGEQAIAGWIMVALDAAVIVFVLIKWAKFADWLKPKKKKK